MNNLLKLMFTPIASLTSIQILNINSVVKANFSYIDGIVVSNISRVSYLMLN